MMRKYLIMVAISPVFFISSSGIYYSFKRLDEENDFHDKYYINSKYRDTNEPIDYGYKKKIETATLGFCEGVSYGVIYTVMSPFILSGFVITNLHYVKNLLFKK